MLGSWQVFPFNVQELCQLVDATWGWKGIIPWAAAIERGMPGGARATFRDSSAEDEMGAGVGAEIGAEMGAITGTETGVEIEAANGAEMEVEMGDGGKQGDTKFSYTV